MSGERDKMAPQLQELAWQNRNLERRVEDLTKDSQQALQVKCLPSSLTVLPPPPPPSPHRSSSLRDIPVGSQGRPGVSRSKAAWQS